MPLPPDSHQESIFQHSHISDERTRSNRIRDGALNITRKTITILCIDTDPQLAGTVKGILQPALGSTELAVLHSGTGEDGLESMRTAKPDFILCSLNLPGMDGHEVCRKARQEKPECAFVLLSDYDPGADHATRARENGADAYLSKPLKSGELVFWVHSALRHMQLNETVHEKNKQLEESLGQLKQFHKKLAALNEELHTDKRRLGMSLHEMTDLNKQLEEKNAEISTMVDELARRFDSTEGLLAAIIELHQADHRGHAERVADMSVFIAEKMKLTDYQIRNIRSAARLHELGIVALPTPERRLEALDEDNNRQRTHHTLVGEMLLKGFPGFELIAAIIRHLHENVDGSGTPDGLYGDRIPVGSRIITAASFFDHARIARPESGTQSLLESMDQRVGTIFDEQVMNYLCEYVDTRMDTEEGKALDCSVFALVEGMELASDIYSESGINLLRKGTVLNRDTLNKIIKFHAMDPISGNVKIKQP